MEIIDLLGEGPIPYEAAWERQRQRVARRQAGAAADALLLLEHAPVVTYGRAADPRFRLLTEAEYARRGIALVATDRGGDVTYHGPGQLVGYPIVHLGDGRRDLRRFVWQLEETLIRAASDLGVEAARASWHAGVWTADGGYLAAIGVKVARWVTHHGFALNVDARVQEGFSTLVPCGQEGRRIATLSGQAQRAVTVPEAARAVAARFLEVFGGDVSLPQTLEKKLYPADDCPI